MLVFETQKDTVDALAAIGGNYVFPGGHALVVWLVEDGETYAHCGDCAREAVADWHGRDITDAILQSSASYETSATCSNCGKDL